MDPMTPPLPPPPPVPPELPLSTPPPPEDTTEMRAGLSGDEVRRRLARAARHEETGRRVLRLLPGRDGRAAALPDRPATAAPRTTPRRALGLDRRRIAELLRVGAKLLELREVDRALCEGRLGWAKVLIVARMATPRARGGLARARARARRARAGAAGGALEGGRRAARAGRREGPARDPLPREREPEHARLRQARAGAAAPGRRAGARGRRRGAARHAARPVPRHRGRTAACRAGSAWTPRSTACSCYESGKRGDPLLVMTEDGPLPVDGGGPGREGAMSEAVRCDAGVRNHHVAGAQSHDPRARARARAHDHRARDVKTPPRMRRRVLRRDGHRCRSCRSRCVAAWSHHKEFRAHGGRTLVHNLITLCTRCHGLVHAGLLVIEGATVDVARFVDATGAAGRGRRSRSRRSRSLRLTPPAPVEALEREPDLEARAQSAGPNAGERGGLVTLARVPAEVDAAWWRRHAHLVRDRGEGGSLCFKAGDAGGGLPSRAERSRRAAARGRRPSPDSSGQEERVLRLRETAEGARALGNALPAHAAHGAGGHGQDHAGARDRGGDAAAAGRGVGAAAQGPRDLGALPGRPSPRAACCSWTRRTRCRSPLLEVLLQALAEGRLSLVLSDGVTARHVTLTLPSLHAGGRDDRRRRDPGGAAQPLRAAGDARPLQRGGVGRGGAPCDREAGAPAKAGLGGDAGGGAQAGAGGARHAARGAPAAGAGAGARRARPACARLDAEEVERMLAGLGYDEEGLDAGEQRYLAGAAREPDADAALAAGARAGHDAAHARRARRAVAVRARPGAHDAGRAHGGGLRAAGRCRTAGERRGRAERAALRVARVPHVLTRPAGPEPAVSPGGRGRARPCRLTGSGVTGGRASRLGPPLR